MSSLHSETTLLESHLNSSVWNIPNMGLKLADAFRLLEKNKKKLKIVEYSVTQCSLEQIFIKFAKGQISDDASVEETAVDAVMVEMTGVGGGE